MYIAPIVSDEASESDPLYAEMVASLYATMIPFLVLAVTFSMLGIYVALRTSDPVIETATLIGLITMVSKAALHIRYRHRIGSRRLTSAQAAGWEKAFALVTLTFAAALGVFASRTFVATTLEYQILATSMLFGYCSGQVVRISARPRLATLSVCLSAIPCALAAVAQEGSAHRVLAVMFALFILGSIESVSNAYNQLRQRIVLNQELANMASIDPLTGLANRLGLRSAIAQRFGRKAGAAGSLIAVHCMDLNGFKALNDSLGHAAGDTMLVSLSRRIEAALRQGDFVGRFGGDEFVFLQSNLDSADEAEALADRIRLSVAEPFVIDGREIRIGASIGTSVGDPAEDAFDTLLALADRRMYIAKRGETDK